ncbi:MAG: hypothetical protein Q7K03_07285 [Dehalococcoidia bacterium]|nr:hypothetical protein [Dehalococcoidia bacterium]
MPVIGKLESGDLLVYEEVAGPANYQSAARPTIFFRDLRQAVTRVYGIFSNDGRVADVAALSGRTLTYRVRGQPAALAQGAGLPEVPDATNLSGSTYRALASGS